MVVIAEYVSLISKFRVLIARPLKGILLSRAFQTVGVGVSRIPRNIAGNFYRFVAQFFSLIK